MRTVWIVAVLAAAACDTSGDATKVPRSTFSQADPLSRQVQGRVVQGTEAVPGATVQLEPSPGFAWDEQLRDSGDPGYLTTTDLGGKYFILNGPFVYDLSVRKDREIVVFRNLSVRGFEPPFAGDAPVRGYTSGVAAATSPAPAPGSAVAYFVSGEDARTVSGDADSLIVTFRRFETVITLHAIEYVVSGGLATATRAGQTDIRVTSSGAVSTVVPTVAIHDPDDINDVRFIAVPPAGFALSLVDVVMDLGLRTNARPVARVAAGTPLHIQIIRGARYFVRATATNGGATSDSGLQYFDPFQDNVRLSLPPPVSDATFDGSNAFSAVADTTICDMANATAKAKNPAEVDQACVSVVEHVLVPPANGISIRIATTDRVTTLPDLSRLGVPRPVGPYTWTVQQFPTLGRVDHLSGEDVRVMVPVSTAAPQVLELR
jgi:hypothetical protein